jgi:hypothetical protein
LAIDIVLIIAKHSVRLSIERTFEERHEEPEDPTRSQNSHHRARKTYARYFILYLYAKPSLLDLTTTGLFRVPGRENENRRLKEALDTRT